MEKEVIYWTKRNGEKISVDEMDINHLRNVLKMILRNVEKAKNYQEQADMFSFDQYWDLD